MMVVRSALMLAALIALWGCAQTSEVKGRVVGGPVSLAMAAGAGDPRLGAGGQPVPDAVVELRGTGADARLVASATSDADGRLVFKLPQGNMTGMRVAVVAKAKGKLPVNSVVALPVGDGRVLVVMKAGPSE